MAAENRPIVKPKTWERSPIGDNLNRPTSALQPQRPAPGPPVPPKMNKISDEYISTWESKPGPDIAKQQNELHNAMQQLSLSRKGQYVSIYANVDEVPQQNTPPPLQPREPFQKGSTSSLPSKNRYISIYANVENDEDVTEQETIPKQLLQEPENISDPSLSEYQESSTYDVIPDDIPNYINPPEPPKRMFPRSKSDETAEGNLDYEDSYSIYTTLHRGGSNISQCRQSLQEESSPLTYRKKGPFCQLARLYDHSGNRRDLIQELKKNKNAFSEANEFGETLMTAAARKGDRGIFRILVDNGGNVAAHDERHMCPIHIAAFYGHDDIVAFLLNRHVNMNQPDQYHYTPLHFAVVNKKVSTVVYLIQVGAVLNIKNDAGKTPYHLSVDNQDKKIQRILQMAMVDRGYMKAQIKQTFEEPAKPDEYSVEAIKKIESKVAKHERLFKKTDESFQLQDQRIAEVEQKYELTSFDSPCVMPKSHSLNSMFNVASQGYQEYNDDEDGEYEYGDDDEHDVTQTPDRYLTNDEKSIIDNNYHKITQWVDVKAIADELLKAEVVGLVQKKKWEQMSRKKAAESFVEMLYAGKRQQLENAKLVLMANNHTEVAHLLP